MRKLLLTAILFVCTILLTGCTVTADRIFTVCAYDEDKVYMYNGSREFYEMTEDGKLVKSWNAQLRDKPVLMLLPEQGDYKITYIEPGHYYGTKQSLEHYVQLFLDEGFQLRKVRGSCNELEFYLDGTEYSMRILFDISGNIRIYRSDGQLPDYVVGGEDIGGRTEETREEEKEERTESSD